MADELGIQIIQRGAIEKVRVETALVAARSPENFLKHLRPHTLVLTPGDRSDAILATVLMAQQGMPLAGLVLTCGGMLAPELSSLKGLMNSGIRHDNNSARPEESSVEWRNVSVRIFSGCRYLFHSKDRERSDPQGVPQGKLRVAEREATA